MTKVASCMVKIARMQPVARNRPISQLVIRNFKGSEETPQDSTKEKRYCNFWSKVLEELSNALDIPGIHNKYVGKKRQ